MPSAKLHLVVLCFLWGVGAAHATDTATDVTMTGFRNVATDSEQANGELNSFEDDSPHFRI